MPSCGSGDLLHDLADLHVQLPQLLLIDRRGRVRHQVHGGGGLRERDDLADRALVRQQRDDPVEAERDAAVRRRAVLERLEEEPESQLRLLLADVEQREDPALQRRVVNTDAAAADLAAVQHQIVRLGAHRARARARAWPMSSSMRRRERMVHGHVALFLRIPLQQREVHDPGERVVVRLEQPVLLRQVQAAADRAASTRRRGSPAATSSRPPCATPVSVEHLPHAPPRPSPS